MSRKIPLGVSLACIFLAIAITAVSTIIVFNNRYNNLIQDLPQRIRQFTKLSEMDELVRSEYYGKVDSDKMDAEVAAGYIAGLDDERSFYLDKESHKVYNDFLKGHISGTGITVRFDSENVCMKVSEVAADSSGKEAGIKKNDLIFSVDGENVTSRNYRALSAKLDGETTGNIKLGLMEKDTAGNITRSSVTVKNGYDSISCKYKAVGQIGYIRLSALYENTADVFCSAIDELLGQGITGMIIDIRDNTSTNIEAAVKIIDRIVPLATEGSGAIATAKNGAGESIAIYSSDAQSLSLPTAVLMNENTDGAAELIACDLRDFGKAKLFGEKTAGNGSVQKLFPLDEGDAVVLSIAKIYPYKSELYDGTGIIPDEEIIYDTLAGEGITLPPANDDLQYMAAYAWLSN